MIDSNNYSSIQTEARGIEKNLGRTSRMMRRFIDRCSTDGVVTLVYVSGPGLSKKQMNAIARYAKEKDLKASEHSWALEHCQNLGTSHSVVNSTIQTKFKLEFPTEGSSLAELLKMTEAISQLATGMKRFFLEMNTVALKKCPDYVYRGFPMSVSETLWEISGHDLRGGSGVLEWCVDEEDASQMLAKMSLHERFEGLVARSHADTMAEMRKAA